MYDSNKESSSTINHDVLYREGKNTQGHVTYTPRLLSVDLKGSLKHLKANGELYNDVNADEESPLWDDIEVVQQEKTEKPKYQKDLEKEEPISNYTDYQFSETVETWTDFMYSRLHPRSINLVNQFEHSNEENAFDCFTSGSEIWKAECFEDDFGDKIRQYIEECNNCQGFQTIFDCTNGFSGLSIKCLEHLNDEYSKSNFAIPIFAPKSKLFKNADPAMTDSIRVINIAMSFSHLIEQSLLFVPLSTATQAWRYNTAGRKFPQLNYKDDNNYETAAILATYLDTITGQYRQKATSNNNSYLSGFCSDLTNYGRKMCAAGMALPFQMGSDQDLIDCLDKQTADCPFFTTLSPNSKIGTDRIVQNVVVRGIPENRLKKPLQMAKDQMKMAAYRCSSVREMFEMYFQCSMYASLSHVTSLPNGMPVQTPYPKNMFDERIGFDGFTNDFVIPNDVGKLKNFI